MNEETHLQLCSEARRASNKIRLHAQFPPMCWMAPQHLTRSKIGRIKSHRYGRCTLHRFEIEHQNEGRWGVIWEIITYKNIAFLVLLRTAAARGASCKCSPLFSNLVAASSSFSISSVLHGLCEQSGNSRVAVAGATGGVTRPPGAIVTFSRR